MMRAKVGILVLGVLLLALSVLHHVTVKNWEEAAQTWERRTVALEDLCARVNCPSCGTVRYLRKCSTCKAPFITQADEIVVHIKDGQHYYGRDAAASRRAR